ncbi:hypothetical protein JB92DRAFT_2901394 [Gautieria morchelliformis]|nr:hypothetical protein JB92DRAFT_2901394 [Gautieria morchelliformis]
MDLHSAHLEMSLVFEPSQPPFWCKTLSPSLFHHLQNPSLCDITVPFMPGPAPKRSSPPRTRPPRPPNAWILYRSAKLKELTPTDPDAPRMPQAVISKAVADMWKRESPAVRAHFERLSDIAKAEHNLAYPGYRFQPVKKADKERLRTEKQADRDRDRATRKPRARPRASATKATTPLFTTEARSVPAASAPSASTSSAPPVAQATLQQPPAVPHRAAPTPPGDNPSTPALSTSCSSPYPPPPATVATPPLVAPQPAVPQRPPSASDWPQQQHPAPLPPFDPRWLEQGPLPNFSHFAGSQEYLPISVHHPLGWSPNDPSPMDSMPFNPDPLHAVLYPTADPNVFNMNNIDFDPAVFDGSREIQVSMGPSKMMSFGDENQLHAFTSLLANLDTPKWPTAATPREDEDAPFQEYRAPSATPDDMHGYSVESLVDMDALHEDGVFVQTQATTAPVSEFEARTPYLPPAGAANYSTRRVAADWRHRA